MSPFFMPGTRRPTSPFIPGRNGCAHFRFVEQVKLAFVLFEASEDAFPGLAIGYSL